MQHGLLSITVLGLSLRLTWLTGAGALVGHQLLLHLDRENRHQLATGRGLYIEQQKNTKVCI